MPDKGVQWGQTPVYIRHFGSKKYLAIKETDLQLSGLIKEEGQAMTIPVSPKNAPPQSEVTVRAELVNMPGPLCQFVMEPTGLLEAQSVAKSMGSGGCVPRDNAAIMLRWSSPVTCYLWLSCTGLRHGKGTSLGVVFSTSRLSRDSFVVQNIDGTLFMRECEVVNEHKHVLQKDITPRVSLFSDTGLAAFVCAQLEHTLTDMIFFLTDSQYWRVDQAVSVPDPLSTTWIALPCRQNVSLQMKYIDTSFNLFHQLVKKTDSLVGGDSRWGRKAAQLEAKMYAREASVSSQDMSGEVEAWEEVMGSMVATMKTRCLKLLVRLWLCSFLGSRKIEAYFHQKGWLDVLNTLNGFGLGASDVFVKLVSNNAELARTIDRETLLKFLDFIRLLGPLDTWFYFLKAVCAPLQSALPIMQQTVLRCLVFAGQRTPMEEARIAERNRTELLVSVALGAPLGVPMGQASMVAVAPLEKVLGTQVLTDGICDVLISWTYPNNWIAGKGVLFHGPDALGLSVADVRDGRAWVSLAQVVWILQPQKCCEVTTGKTWAEMQEMEHTFVTESKWDSNDGRATGGQSRLQDLKTLAKYILAQLRLLDDMVRERQMNCIMTLQDEYSYSLCLCGATDPRLPASIRAAFFNLIKSLWLDRYPHTNISVPALMRSFDPATEVTDHTAVFDLGEVVSSHLAVPDCWSPEHSAQLPDEVRLFYNLGNSSKMECAVRAVRRFLCAGVSVEQMVHGQPEDSSLMLSALSVLQQLQNFGFIVSLPCYQELQGPLLRCLDGRTDWLMPPPEVKQNGKSDTHTHLGIPDVNEAVVPLLQSQQLPLAEPEHHVPPLTKDRFPPISDSEQRYKVKDDHNGIMLCKAQLLRIVLFTTRVSMHSKISRVLELFRSNVYSAMYSSNTVGQGGIQLGSSIIDSFLKIMNEPIVDLVQPHMRSPAVMCADLMMYEDPEIFALALELLFASCCQSADLLNLLDKVELLTPAQDKLFSTIKHDVFTLGRLIYSIENWGVDDHFSTMDNAKCKQFALLCKKIGNLVTTGDGSSSPFEVQKMLHETEFFDHLVYVINMNCSDFPPSSEQLVKSVIAQTCNCAARVVANNSKNQTSAYRSVPHLRRLVGDQPECAGLLAQIFKGNVEFCKRVPEDLIKQFAELILRERLKGKFVMCYIEFFLAIVSPGTQGYMLRNQIPVVDALNRGKPEVMLHLLRGGNESERVLELARRFKSKELLRGEESSAAPSDNDHELLYYLKSLELLAGVASGRGAQALITKPFVSNLLHPTMVIRQLLRTSTTRERRPRDMVLSPVAVAHLRMASRWLDLLCNVVYDVDVNLRDHALLSTPLHVEFVRALLPWTQASIDAPPLAGGPEEEETQYFKALLSCIDSFFSFCFIPVCEYETGEAVKQLGPEYSAFFNKALRANKGKEKKAVNVKRWGVVEAAGDLLAIVGNRVLQVASFDHQARSRMSTFTSGVLSRASEEVSSETEAQWRATLEALRKDPRISARVESDDENVGIIIETIGTRSDPDNGDYVRVLPQDPGDSLPDGVDFRRGLISCEDILRRLMRHQPHLTSDLGTLRRVQRMLLAMIKSARKSSDPMAVTKVQSAIVDAGVIALIVQILDDKVFVGVPEDVTETAWNLLIEVLCAVKFENGSQAVNKYVQHAILEVCKTGVDAGMFDAFREIVSVVTSKAKSVRSLKLITNLVEVELQQIDNYKASLVYAVNAMEAMRLMVEGHFFPMQQHLHSQSGSVRSCNVLEQTTRLLTQVLKDPKGGDLLRMPEIECISQALTLLIELCQGPNLHNQEFLSTLGIVEMTSRLLGISFQYIRDQEGDMYPSTVRRLKALLMDVNLSLVEGRLDSQIHVTIPQRLDPQVLKDRIEFVYGYFAFGIVQVATKSVLSDSLAAMPLDSNLSALLAPSADSTEVYEALLPASLLAEEMLEDLTDSEITEYFSEGLKMLQLVYQVASQSHSFEQFMMPWKKEEEQFKDDPSLYLTERQFIQEKKKYHMRYKYRLAFDFLKRFVRTIEVIRDGNLHYLHFCPPVTAIWYVYGEAKQQILDTVPFSSPDIKAKFFIRMCMQVHRESKLIKDLSRFSIVPQHLLKSAQRTIPDWMHRPFQIFLCDDARNMGRLLWFALLLGLAISVHTGTYLIPEEVKDSDDGDAKLEMRWSSPLAALVAHTLGLLYFICTVLWLLLTVSIKIPTTYLMLVESSDHSSGYLGASRILMLARALGELLTDGHVAWRSVLLFCCMFAFLFSHFWLLCFLLMDFWCQSPVLATVFKAIASPLKSLLMTFLGSIIVTFVYAAIGFRFFRHDFKDFCDTSIIECCQNILYQGTRASVVGLSGMMTSTLPGERNFEQRMAYDVSYFIIFGIIILNTIVGLIVDSFGALRLDMEARESNQETQTFIACIDRRTVDAVSQARGIADGFEYHETYKQNKWDYMSFIFHLCETATEDLTGPEHHIKTLLDRGDATWIPIGRSKFLEGADLGTSQEDMFLKIQGQARDLGKYVDNNMSSMKFLSRSVGQLDTALRDRLDGMMNDVRDLSMELKQQRMLREIAVEQGSEFSLS
eukprot:TRINITY_DN47081_c0_g1_i1.p1 TRINITY_DN47081_c0_g1~~TRINITY_DN47081_c0_g1_i1.p1  ORF type:complete len:2919 (+),score=455.88 TRINITY_DN47081_c0_g1_i1:1094-8758(+)